MSVTEQAPRLVFPEPPGAAKTKARRRLRWRIRGGLLRALRTFLATMWADLRSSWLWSAHPPALREVFASRIPAEAHVPGYHAGGVPAGETKCDCSTAAKASANLGRTVICGCRTRYAPRPADPRIRWAWTVYNHAIALPATAVGYVALWILQHPGRLLLAALVVGPLIGAWRSL